MTDQWTSESFLREGRYAPAWSRRQRLENLGRIVGSDRVGYVTFSARYVLPSLTDSLTSESEEALEFLTGAKTALRVLQAVRGIRVVEELEYPELSALKSVMRGMSVYPMSDPPTRPGTVASVFLHPSNFSPTDKMKGELINLDSHIRGSFIAVSHRERSVYSQLGQFPEGTALVRVDAGMARPFSDLEGELADRRKRFVCAQLLDISSFTGCAVFERRSALHLEPTWVGGSVSDVPALSSSILIPRSPTVPRQWEPEDELVEYESVESAVKVALGTRIPIVAEVGLLEVLLVPFGSTLGTSKAMGGCMVLWQTAKGRSMCTSAMDIAAAQASASHLEREVSSRRHYESFRTLAKNSAALMATTKRETNAGSLTQPLAGRSDYELVLPTVEELIDNLCIETTSTSVTCRVVVGMGPRLGRRALARLACVGGDDRDNSPPIIRIAGGSKSVNGWVASRGKACYLPDIRSGEVRHLELYPGLGRVGFYRKGVGAELCVPIFSEGRLIGTMNLEHRDCYAYDLTASTAESVALIIGVAVALARRELGVRLYEASGGVLMAKHQLRFGLRELESSLRSVQGDVGLGDFASQQVEHLVDRVGRLRQISEPQPGPTGEWAAATESFDLLKTIVDALRKTCEESGVTFRTEDVFPPRNFYQEISGLRVVGRVREAIGVAVKQALNNAIAYSSAMNVKDWEFPNSHSAGYWVELERFRLGGIPNIVVAVKNYAIRSPALEASFNRVFRESIRSESGAVRYGAFLAGEAMRRAGGSACFYLIDSEDKDIVIAVSELAVPLIKID